MLPKAERADDLARVASAAPGKQLLPLVETAAGLDRARELAAAPGVERLAFGSIDFQLDVSIDGDADELLYFRSHLVLASRLGGCLAAGRRREHGDRRPASAGIGRRARAATRIRREALHPSSPGRDRQSGFTPSDEAREWARRVVEASRALGGRSGRRRRQDGRPSGACCVRSESLRRPASARAAVRMRVSASLDPASRLAVQRS